MTAPRSGCPHVRLRRRAPGTPHVSTPTAGSECSLRLDSDTGPGRWARQRGSRPLPPQLRSHACSMHSEFRRCDHTAAICGRSGAHPEFDSAAPKGDDDEKGRRERTTDKKTQLMGVCTNGRRRTCRGQRRRRMSHSPRAVFRRRDHTAAICADAALILNSTTRAGERAATAGGRRSRRGCGRWTAGDGPRARDWGGGRRWWTATPADGNARSTAAGRAADSGKDAAAPSPGRRNECRHSRTQHELRERPIYETIQLRKESR